MALKAFALVLFVFFLGSTSATYCSYSNDCYGYLDRCCLDNVCRERCYSCSYDSQCGTGECCDSYGNCKTSCSYYKGSTIGGIIGSLVFVAIVVSIVSCCCCACCPYHRYRSRGAVVVQTVPMAVATTSTRTQQMIQVQHPPPMGYNPSVTGGYGQPPPPYYPQPQAGPYPPYH